MSQSGRGGLRGGGLRGGGRGGGPAPRRGDSINGRDQSRFGTNPNRVQINPDRQRFQPSQSESAANSSHQGHTQANNNNNHQRTIQDIIGRGEEHLFNFLFNGTGHNFSDDNAKAAVQERIRKICTTYAQDEPHRQSTFRVRDKNDILRAIAQVPTQTAKAIHGHIAQGPTKSPWATIEAPYISPTLEVQRTRENEHSVVIKLQDDDKAKAKEADTESLVQKLKEAGYSAI